MYETFFGLKEKAFNLTPDPSFLYLNQRTREAFEDILYGIERREGFAVIIGDVGTGKTTLCSALLERIEKNKNVRTVLIQNPMLSDIEILRSILQDLGVAVQSDAGSQPPGAWTPDMTKKELIDHLNTFLAERAREGAFTVLIIDESQNLPLEMFEQLRLLSNLETTKKKLLQIIFLGQLELEQKLAQVRQLSQRISFRFETQPLSREDMERYILHRLAIAGGGAHKVRFGRGSFAAIYRYSKGYPRLINIICDRALRAAYKEESTTVTAQMIRETTAALSPTRRRAALLDAGWMVKAGIAAVVLIAAISAFVLLLANRTPGNRPAQSASRAAVVSSLPAPPARVASPAPVQAAPVPQIPPKAETQKTAQYALQVFSFRTAKAAEGYTRQIEALHLPCYTVHLLGEQDEGWYALYAGPFTDLETARRADSEIRAAIPGSFPVLRDRFPPRQQAGNK